MRFQLLLALWAVPTVATAQGTQHLLVVTGLSGEPVFATQFSGAARAIVDSARTRWGIPDSNVKWIAERAEVDARRVGGVATREGVGAAFEWLRRRSGVADDVIILLIGHGSGESAASRIALPGPDPTARDYHAWIGSLTARRVVVIVAASGSGDFVQVLSAPGRVVMTATRSAPERNASEFVIHIARALSTDEADADKDGRTTMLEAFTYARAAVVQAYASRNSILTEHAVLDDNGDRAGTSEPARTGTGDGSLARQVALTARGAVPTDPRAAALLAERAVFERQLEAWKLRKPTVDAATYQRELERLLFAIATRTRDIRALQGSSKP